MSGRKDDLLVRDLFVSDYICFDLNNDFDTYPCNLENDTVSNSSVPPKCANLIRSASPQVIQRMYTMGHLIIQVSADYVLSKDHL